MNCTCLFKYLSDRSEAATVITSKGPRYDYQSAYKYIENNGIKLEGFLVFLEQEYLIELLENEDIFNLYIDNVLPSKYAGRTIK